MIYICYIILLLLAAERRRREEGWNDLGLDQIDANGNGVGSSVPTRMTNQQE